MVDRSSETGVLIKQSAKLGLAGCRQQIETQIGGANRIGLLGDEMAPILKATGSPREGEGNQQSQQTKYSPFRRTNAPDQLPFLGQMVQADATPYFQKQQHAQKQSKRGDAGNLDQIHDVILFW